MTENTDNAECTCAPEDGDYGSGFHFESCPKAETND